MIQLGRGDFISWSMASYRESNRLALLATCLLILVQTAPAQGLSSLISGGKGTAVTPAAAADPLKRTTPRSSIYNFLQACHDDKLSVAAQYLELPRSRSSNGSELASELSALLDRDAHFEVEHLSNSPQGNVGDGLSPDFDLLDSFQWNGQTVPLQLHRTTQGGVAVWLVSADSVAHIPQLFASIGESPFERRLPAALVQTKFIGTSLWIWFALILLALIVSSLSRLLSKAVLALARPVIKRYAKSVQTYRLEAFTDPLRLLVSVIVFRACMLAIAPSALLRDYILGMLTLLFVWGAAALVMRIVDVISDQVISRLDSRQRALSFSVVPLFVRIVKVCVFCFAVLEILYRWGYPTSTILAGLGVGGLAVALAAQKTLENLFGSVSVITDRPVLVGDFCQFGGQVGTIEDIGLRSTRIRTLDRTVVTIPNSVFSTMTLENYSRRDRMWFHPTLSLRRDTTAEQIREMMNAVIDVLKAHHQVDPTDVPLRFTKITKESYDLEVFAYVLTDDFNRFLEVQSELLLKIVEAATKLKIGFAVPFQESIAAATVFSSPAANLPDHLAAMKSGR